MQRYQPPHMRASAGQSSTAGLSSNVQKSPIAATLPTEGSTTRSGASPTPRPSQRNWTKPPASSSYNLASPASDLQPMRRSPIKTGIDDMELLQSVSRSGGDGAEGDALKDWGVQEKYRRYIDERLDRHYASFSRARHTPPPADSTEELHNLGSIVLLFRKLREGVVASHRIDEFAVEVFESSARLAILARNPAQLLSSLSGLVPGLYTAVKAKGKGRQTDDVVQLTDHLGGLHVKDSQAEFASILLIYYLAQTKSRQIFHSTLMDLTGPTATSLRSPFATETPRPPDIPQPFIDKSLLSFAIKASRALAEETFDPFEYLRLISDPQASPYERAVLSWAQNSVRERAWNVMRKAYIDCGVDWAGRWIGMSESDLEVWVRSKGARVEAGKVRLR